MVVHRTARTKARLTVTRFFKRSDSDVYANFFTGVELRG